MLKATHITKKFGHFMALKNVSFEINKGEIVGFLGQNGAGKTTLMRILTSYLPMTSGTVLLDGEELPKNSLTIRQKIGYLPENPPLYENMTVRDYLKFSAKIKDIPVKQQKRHIDKTLTECHIDHVEGQMIGTLSKGYKQRVGIAQAIIHEPKLLILDEPTNGLDPVQNLKVRNLIKNLEYDRTVILSTHILSEIERVAQRVLIIKSGTIILDKPLNTLLEEEQREDAPVTLEDIFIKLHEDKDSHE